MVRCKKTWTFLLAAGLFLLGLGTRTLRAQGLTVRDEIGQAFCICYGGLRWFGDSGIEFRSDTAYLSDGRLHRFVFQEATQTPKHVQRKEVWQHMNYPKEDPSKERISYIFGRISKPKRPTTGDYFFQASGVFPSADKLPDHVVLKSPGLPDSKLVRQATRTDLVFVTEYSWRETLTRVVKPAEVRKAREDLADLILEGVDQAVLSKFDKDYDWSEVFRWLRADGKRVALELLEEIDKARSGQTNLEKQMQALVRVMDGRCKKWGIDPDKDLVSQLATTISKRVRDKTGHRVSEETARRWLKGDLFDWAAFATNAVEAMMGGGEALQKKMTPLLVRGFGLHPTDGPCQPTFSFTMTLPGVIMESNGFPPPTPEVGGMVGTGGSSYLNVIRVQKSAPSSSRESKVYWSFNRQDAHPGGYTMFVRTLASDRALEQELIKGAPLESKEAVVAYQSLVGESEQLLNVLRECRKQETMQPLYDYRDRLEGKQKEERDRVDRVLKILHLPAR